MLFRLRQIENARMRLISAVVAFGVFVASLPLQLSVTVIKAGAKPFGCQHRACGCMSAEQCAQKCCCSNRPAEKIPARVSPATSGCCLKTKVASTSQSQPPSAEPTEGTKFRVVSSIQSRHCRGLVPLWMTLGDVCPPEPRMPQFSLLRCRETCVIPSEALIESSLAPPVPPPRIGHCADILIAA